MQELDTNKIFMAIAGEVQKLPPDKVLHFSASYGLCLNSKCFSENGLDSSICIIKALLDSYRIGLKKEYNDVGKDFTIQEVLFDKLIENLYEIYKSYKANGIGDLKHETDLLADLMGSGTFVVNQAGRMLNYHDAE
jgi:hypothetical protein